MPSFVCDIKGASFVRVFRAPIEYTSLVLKSIQLIENIHSQISHLKISNIGHIQCLASYVLVCRDHTSLGLRSTESNENRQHRIDLKYLVSVIFNGKLSKNYIDYIFGQLGLGIKIATATILTVNRLISVLPCLSNRRLSTKRRPGGSLQ